MCGVKFLTLLIVSFHSWENYCTSSVSKVDDFLYIFWEEKATTTVIPSVTTGDCWKQEDVTFIAGSLKLQFRWKINDNQRPSSWQIQAACHCLQSLYWNFSVLNYRWKNYLNFKVGLKSLEKLRNMQLKFIFIFNKVQPIFKNAQAIALNSNQLFTGKRKQFQYIYTYINILNMNLSTYVQSFIKQKNLKTHAYALSRKKETRRQNTTLGFN